MSDKQEMTIRPSELNELLGTKADTTRKWAIALERELKVRNIVILRDEHNKRLFRHHEIEAFKTMQRLLSEGRKLESAASMAAAQHFGIIDETMLPDLILPQAITGPVIDNHDVITRDLVIPILEQLQDHNEKLHRRIDQMEQMIREQQLKLEDPLPKRSRWQRLVRAWFNE